MQTKGEASKGVSCPNIKQEQDLYHRKKTTSHQSKTKQNCTLHYCTNPLDLRWRRTLDWWMSAHRQASADASVPYPTPWCNMSTYFAGVIQSRPSLATTPNVTLSCPLTLFGITRKASGGFWRQLPQDVPGRPSRLGPCTTSRPNMISFNSQVDASLLSFRAVWNRFSR